MANPAGRPPVGPRVTVRLPADVLARIDQEADRQGESRAMSIRRLLGDALGPADDGVDIGQIRRALALSPDARLRAMVEAERRVAAVRGRAAR